MDNTPACGCCPTCGALPGHQNPATGAAWQHSHSLDWGKINNMRSLKLYEMTLAVHPKDHEPDWPHGVCRVCGLGRIREVDTNDDRTVSPPGEGTR